MIKDAMDKLDKTKLSDPNVMKQIISFRDRLNENKVISRADVLSIEEFVGLPVITVHTNANKFSSGRSYIGVDEAITGLNHLVDNFVPNELFTYEELVKAIIHAKQKLSDVIHYIKKIKEIPKENIDRFKNEKIVLAYRDEDGVEGNDLIDVTKTISIANLFMYRNDLLSSLLDNGKFDFVKESIINIVSKNEDAFRNEYTPLLYILSNKISLYDIYNHRGYVIDTVFITDIINMYYNIDAHLEYVEAFLNTIKTDYNEIVLNDNWYVTCNNETFMSYYRGYKLINGILNDNFSLELLKLITAFK